MKIKQGFIKKEIMDEIVVVGAEKEAADFSGLIKLNSTASLIWDKVEEGKSIDEIANDLSQIYEVSVDDAKNDVISIVNKMKEAGVFVD